jgi:hypothetical protein
MLAFGFCSTPSVLRPLGLRSLGLVALVALAAAAIGYLAHHASPLEGHAAQTAALVVVVAAVLAVALGAAVAARRPLSLPDVVVASPGAASLRPAQRDDLHFCTALHARTLDHGFFMGLGATVRALLRGHLPRLSSRYGACGDSRRASGRGADRRARHQLVIAGAVQVGSPWILGAGGSQSFTDEVQEDHIHLQQTPTD